MRFGPARHNLDSLVLRKPAGRVAGNIHNRAGAAEPMAGQKAPEAEQWEEVRAMAEVEQVVAAAERTIAVAEQPEEEANIRTAAARVEERGLRHLLLDFRKSRKAA